MRKSTFIVTVAFAIGLASKVKLTTVKAEAIARDAGKL